MEVNVRSLADLKRYLVVGARLRGIWYHYKGDCDVMRIVAKVQTNAVQFEALSGEKAGAWMSYQKAGQYKFTSDGFEVSDETGKPLARYKFPA